MRLEVWKGYSSCRAQGKGILGFEESDCGLNLRIWDGDVRAPLNVSALWSFSKGSIAGAQADGFLFLLAFFMKTDLTSSPCV
jgi:hypothetical protein